MDKTVTYGITIVTFSHIKYRIVTICQKEFFVIIEGKYNRIAAFVVTFATSHRFTNCISHKGNDIFNICFTGDGRRIPIMLIYKLHLCDTRKVIFSTNLDFSARCIIFTTSNGQHQNQNNNK